ncbi:plasmid mobilization relaxosome protein MobC [Polaribacter undariae]|nr:plasmid mobilization relaxosome protein MobC [Polaribacter undariae]MDN3618616.1 plasmid mobilization relaxosome protein MobC [Polaribacter undariae]UWD30403.1 plasmid mobilization relaxosome protein MobC [Polaribacter undariae]
MNNQNKTRIVFYLDFNDKILLNNQCELLQVKASFYIRQCVLEKLGKPILEVKQKHLETKNYTLQLYKIGNNLNQISRKLNSGIKLKLTDEDLIINDIEELKKHIIDIQSKLN